MGQMPTGGNALLGGTGFDISQSLQQMQQNMGNFNQS